MALLVSFALVYCAVMAVLVNHWLFAGVTVTTLTFKYVKLETCSKVRQFFSFPAFFTVCVFPQATTITKLKEMVQDKEGIPPDQQTFVVEGKVCCLRRDAVSIACVCADGEGRQSKLWRSERERKLNHRARVEATRRHTRPCRGQTCALVWSSCQRVCVQVARNKQSNTMRKSKRCAVSLRARGSPCLD